MVVIFNTITNNLSSSAMMGDNTVKHLFIAYVFALVVWSSWTEITCSHETRNAVRVQDTTRLHTSREVKGEERGGARGRGQELQLPHYLIDATIQRDPGLFRGRAAADDGVNFIPKQYIKRRDLGTLSDRT